MTLFEFTSSNNLDCKKIIDVLNSWCGFESWSRQSKISKDQLILFRNIDWNNPSPLVRSYPPEISGKKIKFVKLPKHLQKIPTLVNIGEIARNLTKGEFDGLKMNMTNWSILVKNNPEQFQILYGWIKMFYFKDPSQIDLSIYSLLEQAEEEVTIDTFLLISIIILELTDDRITHNFKNKKDGKLFDPSKAKSIFALYTPMGNKKK